MPLPHITNGIVKRCSARTRSRNLEPCLNPAAHGTSVCRVHGAVPLNKRPRLKGAAHGQYIHGKQTQENRALRKKNTLLIRSLEDILVLIGVTDKSSLPLRGSTYAEYVKIETLEQAEAYLLELEKEEQK